MHAVAFRETQSFREPWIWAVVGVSLGLVAVTTIYGLIQQLMMGRPWGDQPVSDTSLLAWSLFTLTMVALPVLLFWKLKLIVEVRDDGVLAHFWPVKKRLVPYSDIERVEACEYRPIRDYGGWGIKKGRGGWAYNVSGNRGVRLHLMNGKHLLLGSQKDHELAAAIEEELHA